MVDAMAMRVVRVSDLEMAIEELRSQIKEAGQTPVANNPLLGETNNSKLPAKTDRQVAS